MTHDVGGDCRNLLSERERVAYSEESNTSISETDKKVSTLYKAWSGLLSESTDYKGRYFQTIRLSKLNVPEAPHLENCKLSSELNQRLDTRLSNGSFPPWTIWKGMLDKLPFSAIDEQLKQYRDHLISQGAYPPWVRTICCRMCLQQKNVGYFQLKYSVT